MEKNKLYGFVLLLSVGGMVWILANRFAYGWVPGGCLFHTVTRIPCPACGSTRAVLACIKGQYINAFFLLIRLD